MFGIAYNITQKYYLTIIDDGYYYTVM